MKPTDLGFTPEEASKFGGPVLVIPSATSRGWRYRYYSSEQNRCQEDLKKMLDDRARENATDPAPYCTDNPTAPPIKGNALVF